MFERQNSLKEVFEQKNNVSPTKYSADFSKRHKQKSPEILSSRGIFYLRTHTTFGELSVSGFFAKSL